MFSHFFFNCNIFCLDLKKKEKKKKIATYTFLLSYPFFGFKSILCDWIIKEQNSLHRSPVTTFVMGCCFGGMPVWLLLHVCSGHLSTNLNSSVVLKNAVGILHYFPPLLHYLSLHAWRDAATIRFSFGDSVFLLWCLL